MRRTISSPIPSPPERGPFPAPNPCEGFIELARIEFEKGAAGLQPLQAMADGICLLVDAIRTSAPPVGKPLLDAVGVAARAAVLNAAPVAEPDIPHARLMYALGSTLKLTGAVCGGPEDRLGISKEIATEIFNHARWLRGALEELLYRRKITADGDWSFRRALGHRAFQNAVCEGHVH